MKYGKLENMEQVKSLSVGDVFPFVDLSHMGISVDGGGNSLWKDTQKGRTLAMKIGEADFGKIEFIGKMDDLYLRYSIPIRQGEVEKGYFCVSVAGIIHRDKSACKIIEDIKLIKQYEGAIK